MVYLVTKSQYDRVVFRFLNEKNLNIIEKSDEALFFTDSVDKEYSQIYFSQIDGECYIQNKLINEVSNLFSLYKIDAKHVIGRWVQEKTGLPVIKVGGVETIYSPGDFR